jgi:hypothetical protein
MSFRRNFCPSGRDVGLYARDGVVDVSRIDYTGQDIERPEDRETPEQ